MPSAFMFPETLRETAVDGHTNRQREGQTVRGMVSSHNS